MLANVTDPAVIRTVRGVPDFTYYAYFEVHTDESLAHLDAAWAAFHENKDIFRELGIHKDLNISKLHNIKHYLNSIRSLGSAANFNMEATEQLHIDFTKVGYLVMNEKAYIKQMMTWLKRQDAIHRFDTYLQWVSISDSLASQVDGTVLDSEDENEVDNDLDDVGVNPQ